MIFETDITVCVTDPAVFNDGSNEATASLSLTANSLLQLDADDLDQLAIESPSENIRVQLDDVYQSLRRRPSGVPLLSPLRPPFMEPAILSYLRGLKLPSLNLSDLAKFSSPPPIDTRILNDVLTRHATLNKFSESLLSDLARQIAESLRLSDSIPRLDDQLPRALQTEVQDNELSAEDDRSDSDDSESGEGEPLDS